MSRRAILRRAVAAIVVISVLSVPRSGLAEEESDVKLELSASFPPAPGGMIEISIVATHVMNTASHGAYEVHVVEPDSEEDYLGPISYDYGPYTLNWSDTTHYTLSTLRPGPYIARVVRLDGSAAITTAEVAGWIGPPDVPVLVLEQARADTLSPSVGDTVTVSVDVTNRGSNPGSRTFQVWIWHGTSSKSSVASVQFEDVQPGETRTNSVAFTATEPVSDATLEVGSEYVRGRVLGAFQVLQPGEPDGDSPSTPG